MGGPFGSFRRLLAVGILRKHSGASSAPFGRALGLACFLGKDRRGGLPRLAAAGMRGGRRDQRRGLSGLRESSPVAQPRRTMVTAPEPTVCRVLPAGAGAVRLETGYGGRNRLTRVKPLDRNLQRAPISIANCPRRPLATQFTSIVSTFRPHIHSAVSGLSPISSAH